MDKDNEKEPVGKSNPLIERQIEEILRSSERTYRRKMLWNRIGNGINHFFRRLGQGGRGSPSSRLMLWGLLLTLAGVFVAGGPAAKPIASLLVLAGIIMFISPIFLSFRRAGGRGTSPGSNEGKYWRGRSLNEEDPWQATKQQVNNVARWLRGGKNPPPRNGPRR